MVNAAAIITLMVPSRSHTQPISVSSSAAHSMFTPLQAASNCNIWSRQTRNVPWRATTSPCACSRATAIAAETMRIG